jgi:hypothetical protein
MKAHGHYNTLLKVAVDIIIQHDIDLRVYHIPGEFNTIADALSRKNFTTTPMILVSTYAPPPYLEKALRV